VTTENAADRLRRRYPSRRLSTPLLAVLGLVIAVLVAYVVWVAAHRASPPVTGRVDSFQVVSDTEVTARLTVDRPNPAVAARCFLYVQAPTFDRVGERWLDVPPGPDQLTIVDVSVRTFKRGTTIVVDKCGPS
jgi:hypothetical protein